MNNTAAHQQFQDRLLMGLGSRPDIRLFPRKVGMAIPIGRDRPIYFGIKGESDLQGLIRPQGRHLSIEIKTGSGKLEPEQLAWRNMVIKFGGIHIVARWDYEYETLDLACKKVVDELERSM